MTRDNSFPCCGFQGGLFNIMRPDKRELALKMTEETKHHAVFWGSSVLEARDWFEVLCKLEEGAPKCTGI